MLTTFPVLVTFLWSILRRHKIFLNASLRRYGLIVGGVVTFIRSHHFGLSDCSSRRRLVIDRLRLRPIIFESVVKLVGTKLVEHICPIFIIVVSSASQWIVTHILWLRFLSCLLILLWCWYVLSLLLIVAILRFRLVLRRLLLFFVVSLLNRRRVVDNNLPV